jgi:hypothetical protein
LKKSAATDLDHSNCPFQRSPRRWYHGLCDTTLTGAKRRITSAGTRGVVNDAIAVDFRELACALGFVARWCSAGDPPGFYQVREDEPTRSSSPLLGR